MGEHDLFGFSAPAAAGRRIKVVVLGPMNAGKTHFALSWPNPLVVDTDAGVEAFAGRFQFQRRDDVRTIEELTKLAERLRSEARWTEPHTLVVDTITSFAIKARAKQQRNVRTRAIDKKRNPDIEGFSPTDWQQMRIPWYELLEAMSGLPCHTILTAHQAPIYDKKMKVLGFKADGEPKLDHWADVMLRLEVRGAQRVAWVVKDRWGIWQPGVQLKNASFALFARHVAVAEGKPIVEETQSAPGPPAGEIPASSTPAPPADGAVRPARPEASASPPEEPHNGEPEVPPIVRTIAGQSKALFTRPGPTAQHKPNCNRAKWLDWMLEVHAVDLSSPERATETIMKVSEAERGYILGAIAQYREGALWEAEESYLAKRQAEQDTIADEAEREAERDREGEA